MRKVAVITASRSDFGNYLPLLNAVKKCSELQLMLSAWGDDLDYLRGGFQRLGQEQKFTVDDNLQITDWLIVSGDTMPMLKACIWAAEHNIPIIHLGGGDSTTGACIDEQTRHAITRFAHLHFPQTQASADRLIRMGEESWRVQVSGPLGIYAMPDAEFLSEHDVRTQLGLDAGKIFMNGVYTKPKPTVIVIQHPVSSQVEQAGEQMRITLEAVAQIPDIQPVVIYPNSEPGNVEIVKVINSYAFPTFNNLPFLTFQSLLKYSSVIVGNSSCAIVEAPFYGVPAVNVGIRQEGREHANNLLNVPHDAQQINQAIKSAMFTGTFRINMGMDKLGNCWDLADPFKSNPDGIQKIITALTDTPIDNKLMRKKISF